MEEAIHFRCPCFLQPPSSSKHRFSPYHLPKIPNSSSQKARPSPPTLLAKGLVISPRAPLFFPKCLADPLPSPSIPPSPFGKRCSSSIPLGSTFLPTSKTTHASYLFLSLNSAPPSTSSSPSSSPHWTSMCGMCSEILTAGGPSAFNPVLNFLLREAGVQCSDLRYIISRCSRLLVSDIAGRLRPTLYFLRMLGITETARHAYLLSCSIEEKLIPRLEFLQKIGFSSRDARSMARRFPQIFCYSIKQNLEPKFEFFAREMKRELRELKGFPQYFSFSFEKKIKPRYRLCRDNGVFFELPALLKPSDDEFQRRLEVCISSSPPLRRSPLWKEGLGE